MIPSGPRALSVCAEALLGAEPKLAVVLLRLLHSLLALLAKGSPGLRRTHDLNCSGCTAAACLANSSALSLKEH